MNFVECPCSKSDENASLEHVGNEKKEIFCRKIVRYKKMSLKSPGKFIIKIV